MIRGLRKSFSIFIFLVMALCSVYATEIHQEGNLPFKTNTDIVTNGNVTNIQANTTLNLKGHTVGVNTFGKFNVSENHIVNLNLINGQTKLINLIYDDKASIINGTVNSYMNGNIGGNVLFANPNGFVIGEQGAFNVGSLTLITPNNTFMNETILKLGTAEPELSEDGLGKLISFKFNDNNYVICNGIGIKDSSITIDGEINAEKGIDIITRNITIGSNAKLNANVEFQENGDVPTHSPSSVPITPTPSTFAMDDGNGIIIVSTSGIGTNNGTLESIVNLKGSINPNGSDVTVSSEYNTPIQLNVAMDKVNNLNVRSFKGSISSTSADFVAKSVNLSAQDAIELVNKGDINLASIESKSHKNCTLTSSEGSINSVVDELSLYNTSLNAEKGGITLKDVTSDGKFTANSKTFEINNLTNNGYLTEITTTEKAELGTVNVKDFNLNAGSAEITNLASGITNITTTTGDMSVGTLTTTGNTTLSSVKDIVLGETGVTGRLTASAGNDLKFNDTTTVTGLATLSGKNVSSTEGTKLTFDDDLIINNTGAVDLDLLSVTGRTEINATGLIKLGTLSTYDLVMGGGSVSIADLTTDARAKFDLSDTLTITKGVIGFIQADAKKIVVENSLTTNSTEDNSWLKATDNILSIGTLTTKTNVTLTSKADMTVTSLNTTGSADLSSKAAVTVTTATVGDDDTVSNMTISSTGALSVGTGNVTGDLIIEAGSAEITELKTTTGSANITTTGDLTITTLDAKTDAILTSNTGNIGVTTLLKSGQSSTVTATNGSITLGTVNSGKDFTSNSKSLVINTAMTVAENVNMTADTITITPSVEFVNLTTSAGSLKFDGLTVTGKADITATGKIEANTVAINTLEKLSAKSADIKTLTIDLINNKTINITDDLTLDTASFDSVTISAKSLNVTTSLKTTTGTANITTTGDLTIESLDAKTDATLTSNTGAIKLTSATVGKDATLSSFGSTSVTTGEITGALNVTKSDSFTSGTKLTVSGETEIQSDGAVTLEDTDLQKLTIKSDSAKVAKLNSALTKFETKEKTELTTAKTGDLTIIAGSTDITSLTSGVTGITTENGLTKLVTAETGNLTIKAATAEIGSLTSALTEIITGGMTTIETATVDSITLDAGTVSVTNSLKTTKGNATITAKTGDMTVESLTSAGDATLSSFGSTSVTTGEITGALNVTKSDSFTSGTKLTVSGETEIQSKGAVTLEDTDLQKLTIKSNSAKVAKLNSALTKFETKEKTELTTAKTGDLTIVAGSADITSLTSGVTGITTENGLTKLVTAETGNLTINADTAEIGSLTSAITEIITGGMTTIETATVDSITLDAGAVNVTNSLKTIKGNATITAKTGNMTVESLTSAGDAILTSTSNNITLGTTTVGGALSANAGKILTINKDAVVTGKTTLSGTDKIVFKDTDSVVFNNDLTIENTGNVNLQSLTVNADADITAQEINIGTFVVNKDSDGNRGNATITSDGVANIENATIESNFTTDVSNLNIKENLTVGGIANLGSNNNIIIKDADINILDTKGATNVTIDNLDVTNTASLVATKDITLGTSNIGGETEIISTGGNVSLGETTVGGPLTAKATKDLTINGEATVNGKTTLSGGENLIFAKSKQVTFDKDLDIIETGYVNLDSLTVKGNLTTDAKNIKITEKLVVDGTANLGSKENIDIKVADINILDTKGATNVTIEDLTVRQDAYLQANGNVVFGVVGATGTEFGTTKITGDLTIESEKNITLNGDTNVGGHTSLLAKGTLTFKPEDVTFATLTVEEGTGNVIIENLNITKWADINCDGKTTITNADVQGDLTTNTRNLEITNLTVTGKTVLHSNELITLHNSELADLTTKANNMTIDDMTVEGLINIDNTGNLKVTNMLKANDEVNMKSDASINIVDAEMAKNLNLNSKDATIQEITLVGNLNGKVDKLDANTTKTDELKIGYIEGKSKPYATSTKITTPNTVVNGLGEEYSTKDINIYGKNITIDATTQVASPDKQLNFKLAKNNNIWLYSDGTIDVFTTGEVGNYRNIVTDNLNIKTDSSGINIYSALVSTYGDIRLKGKHIIIDNTTWAPDLYVTLHLRSITTPHYLFVNSSPFIRTQPLNSLRHGINIYVNKTKDCTSMNSWLTSSMEAQMKTSNVAEKFVDKTNKTLDVWSTLDSYVANFNVDGSESIVRTVKGEIITTDNVGEFINSNRNNSVKKRKRLFKRKQSMEISLLK